jgi:mono/diheme cytochrome c family protein
MLSSTVVRLCALALAALQPQAAPRLDGRAAAGQRLYEAERCFACHQIDGRGNKAFPLDGVAARLTPVELRRWLTDTRAMEDALPRVPAIRMSARRYKFKDADVEALVAFLETLR